MSELNTNQQVAEIMFEMAYQLGRMQVKSVEFDNWKRNALKVFK